MTLEQVRQADPVKGYPRAGTAPTRARGRRTSSSRRSTQTSAESNSRKVNQSEQGQLSSRNGAARCARARRRHSSRRLRRAGHRQGGRGGRGEAPREPPPTPRAAAPIDLTGYWVSVITEDWRWRMVTPPKGDYASLPINAEAKKVADAWDAAKDVAAGDQCKAYGAPGLMRLPTRLRISWQDDTTLKVETDAGHADAVAALRRLEAASRRTDATGQYNRAVGNAPGPARCAAASAGAALRQSQDGDDGLMAGLPAQERRSVQRKDDAHRVLGPAASTQRRAMDRDHDGRRGPDVSDAHVDHVAQLQEGSQRIEVGSVGVRGELRRCEGVR